MSCHCANLPSSFFAEEAPSGFIESLAERAVSQKWKRLCSCPECGSLWAVDEWDKYQEKVVTRVSEKSRWDEHSEDDRKALLLRSRGGTVDEQCVWAGCAKKRVRGVAMCVDHLYATGARR